MLVTYGGLGIKNLIYSNQALLGKWLWRFATEQDALWRKVVALKYGISPGNWVSVIGHGPYGISLWKLIRKGWEKFQGYIKFEVGNGNCICFWEDHWCGDRPLGEMFPMVYRVVRQKDVLVAEYLSWHNGAPQWDLCLNWNLHD